MLKKEKFWFTDLTNQNKKSFLSKTSTRKLETTLHKLDKTPPNIIAWKNKKIKFTNASLLEVFNTLEEIYSIDISVADPVLLNCSFTGKFNNKNWKKILKQLSFMYNFQLETSKNQALITGGDDC